MSELRTYFEQSPLSGISIGNIHSDSKVFVLHGLGSSALAILPAAETLASKLPDTEIISLNGFWNVSDRMKSGETGFAWNHNGAPNRNAVIAERIGMYGGNPNKTFILGFSQGGFVASDIVYEHPQVSNHAILHSSILMGKFNPKAEDTSKQKPLTQPAKSSYYTLVSADDPYLRSPFLLALFFEHYPNSRNLRRQGHSARTQISFGFGHGYSEKSLEMCAQHIRLSI